MTGDEPNIDPSVPLPTHHQTPEEIFTWYANLGMYVQAFEQLVQSVRSACIDLTTPGNWEQPPHNSDDDRVQSPEYDASGNV